jgi:hypothetical protein
VLIPGKPMQPDLIFAGKLRSKLQSGAQLGWLWPNSQTLDLAGTGNHSSLFRTFVNYRCKMLYNIGPGVYVI